MTEQEKKEQKTKAEQAAQTSQTGYNSQWSDQINDLLDKYQNREDFAFDVDKDALYQQYKDQYIRNGKLAMADTMGQAAALTGGYGNSYAQSVGQQTYNQYLEGLNDRVPELYEMALEQYTRAGNDLLGDIQESLGKKFTTKVGEAYLDGTFGADRVTELLTTYGEKDPEEAEIQLDKWDFELEYGYSWSEVSEGYQAGDISREAIRTALMNISGKTGEEAEETIRKWEFKVEWGFDYSDRKEQYQNGSITASQLRDMMMDMDGKTEAEADRIIAQYDWETEVPGSEGIGYGYVEDYYAHAAPAGVSKEAFTDAWKIKRDAKGTDLDADGKTDAYSIVDEVFPQINALALTPEQKTAVAKALGWGDRTIRKYKTW